MSDIVEEIKEEVRLDQVIAFLRKYGHYLILGGGGVLLAGLLYSFWHNAQEKQKRRLATQFEQALQASDEKNSSAALTLLKALEESGSKGYDVLAAFRRALLASTSPVEKAQIYTQILQNRKMEPKFRELAGVLWGYESVESESPSHLQEVLNPIAESISPWRDSAHEILALLDIRLGNIPLAAQRLKALMADENVTEGVRARALALLEHLGG